MNSGKKRFISLAIPIIALAAALCLTRLMSFLPYRSTLPARNPWHNLSLNTSSTILSPAELLPKLQKRTEVAPLERMSDETWNKKVVRGTAINCLFERPIGQVPQSKFQKWQDISDWGWVYVEDTSFFINNKLESGAMLYLDTFFKKYPLPTKPWETPGLRVHNMDHTNKYNRPGATEEQKPTGAEFDGWALIGGADVTQYYIANAMYSPWYKGELQGVEEMPDLQRWSDLFALEWYHLQGGLDDGSSKNIRTPRYIIIPSLVRYKTDTQEAVIRACTMTNQQLGDMPGGCEFEPVGNTAEAFFGMLGTAHLQGMGFMLAQHKAWFGNKKIDKITAWIRPNENDNTIYNLLVSIADVNELAAEGTPQKRNSLVYRSVLEADEEAGTDNGSHLPKPKL